MKKSLFILTLIIGFNFSVLIAEQTDGQNSNNDKNNKNNKAWLSEAKTWNKINKIIDTKFGSIKKAFATIFWPFLSQNTIDSIRLDNDEIRSIRNMVADKMNSSNNFKNITVRKPSVKYVTQVVRKPVEKTIIEWKEIEKQVPVKSFKDVERKRYDINRIKQNFYSTIVDFITKKSYEYAADKTKSSSIADKIQKTIYQELIQRIKLKNFRLKDFIGRNRESKIDEIIIQLLGGKK